MLGIVAAFKEEVNHYLKSGGFRLVAREGGLRTYQSPTGHLAVIVGGVGRKGAEEATRLLIDGYRPEFIVSAGFAGAVRKGIAPGDVFVCDRLMSIEGPAAFWQPENVKERSPMDAGAMEGLAGSDGDHARYALCGCLTVPQLVPSSEMKVWIGNTLPVSLVDMEGYWVSETAAASGIPHLMVRSVLDTVEQTLPEFVGVAMSMQRARWIRAARHLIRKPGEAPGLLRLARLAKVSAASLGDCLAELSAERLPPGSNVSG